MRNNPYKKMLIFGIIIILIGTSILPEISAKPNNKYFNEKNNQETSTVTLYAIEETSTKENKIDISIEDAEIIFNLFKELKQEITQDPYSEKTQDLRNQFVSLLNEKGMLPEGISKNKFISLLSPPSLNQPKSNTIFNKIYNFRKTMINPLFDRIVILLEDRFNNFDPHIESHNASAALNFCTIASYGDGYTIPVMIPVRPRIGIVWDASSSETYAGEVFSNKAVYATGAQTGSTVGFTGGGGTFAFPGFKFYVLVGYTWHVTISADNIDFFPPNQPPVVSEENPKDGEEDIPVSLSELSFRISDQEGEKMDYTVTTEPDIGSGSGSNKGNGFYQVPISGLEYDKMYTWTVEVTDGNFIVEKKFIFYSPLKPPFDPFDEGWQYCKKITIDHNRVAGDLINFPVLISIVDSDLKNKAQDDFDDILFMEDIGIASKMFHEIEKYDSSTGELITWVKIPNILSSADSDLYMYYGNPSCSNQQYPSRVWDSNYAAVWHMDGNSYTEFKDSTKNSFDATSDIGNPTFQQSTKIGYGVEFDGTDDIINICDDDKFSFCDSSSDKPCSIEAWIKMKEPDGYIIAKYTNGDTGEWVFNVNSDNKCRLYLRDSIGDHRMAREMATNVTSDIWTYVSITFDGGTSYQGITCYQNGIDNNGFGERLSNYVHMRNKGEIVRIGGRTNYDRYFEGMIDEIRISNIERSSAWINTGYNTMNDPSTFFSVGPEVPSP